MGVFRQILVAADLSEASAPAFRLALRLTKDQGATLTVVHVYPLPVAIYGMYPMAPPILEPSDQLQRAAESALRDWLRRIDPDTTTMTVVRDGIPATEILEQVKLSR